MNNFCKRLMKIVTLLLLLSFFYNCNSTGSFRKTSDFDYSDILKKKFKKGMGESIFLTVENGETYSGSITPDQKYLFYSNNKNGNFDIYMRYLKDVTVIPLLKTATNQTSPAISPNGKLLLYIDDEKDTDGDVVLLEIAPEDALDLYLKEGYGALEVKMRKHRKFLTSVDQTKIYRSTENNPVWASNNKTIAYDSNRPSIIPGSQPDPKKMQNIWLLNTKNPKHPIQLTDHGGIMPSFSPDGKKLAYISYEDENSNGDIYEIDLSNLDWKNFDREALQRTRITSGSAFDLSPNYTADGKYIICTRIANDSNKDGAITRLDHGKIIRVVAGVESNGENPIIELKPDDENVFDTRVSTFLGGSILYAIAEKDNINIAFIPISGIIPKQNSPRTQFEFAEKYGVKNARYRLAMEKTEILHTEDPYSDIFSAQKDIKLYNLNIGKPDAIIKNREAKIKEGRIVYKVLWDLNYLETKKGNSKLLVQAETKKEYLRQLLEKPDILENYYLSLKPETGEISEGVENETEDNSDKLTPEGSQEKYFAEHDVAMKLVTIVLYEQTADLGATRFYYKLFLLEPGYYNNILFVKKIGDHNLKSIGTISQEYLFILDPENNKIDFVKALQNEDIETIENEQIPETANERIAKQITLSDRQAVENKIFDFFSEKYINGQENIVASSLEPYPEKEYPLLHLLSFIAMQQSEIKTKHYGKARLLNDKIHPEKGSQWEMQLAIHQALLYEEAGDKEQAFASYANALYLYRSEYRFTNRLKITHRTLGYYKDKVENQKSNKQYEQAWENYKKLISLTLHMHVNDTIDSSIKQETLNIFVGLDEMALEIDRKSIQTNLNQENYKKLLEEINEFYDANVATARKNLINPFIFGRAYLHAMLGIQKHIRYEKTYQLNKKTKKEILIDFKHAEIDFNWSFFAEPGFSDSYIMLGWVYQFIDEKRNTTYTRLDNTKVLDKARFHSVYGNLFPEQLFEKNIHLYKKSLAFLPDQTSSSKKESFYLNIANNYFLLRNYTKAIEYYSKITLTGKDRFHFDTPLQKTQFHFHLGKSYFFDSQYSNASKHLKNTLAYYKTRSKKKNITRENKDKLQKKIHTILKYLGLNSSEAGNYNHAIRYYLEILNDRRQLISQENDISTVYLEASRMYLELAKQMHDLSYVKRSLALLGKVEVLLHHQVLTKEIKAPQYKIQATIAFIPIPFAWNTDYSYIMGDNHLAYLLPTINRWQYYYSLKAHAYEMIGKYGESQEAVELLIKKAKEDKSYHGEETLLSAQMRLAHTFYIQGEFDKAIDQYETAKALAYEQKQVVTLQKAQKNILLIVCEKVTQEKSTYDEKIIIITKAQKELDKFIKKYIKNKIKVQQEEYEDKDIELSTAEKILVRKEAYQEISKIWLYKGIFQTLIAIYSEHQNVSDQKLYSFEDYIENKQKQYNKYARAEDQLNGILDLNDEQIALLEESDERRLAIVLTINRAKLFESMNLHEKAAAAYEDVYYKAVEFQSYELIILSAKGYYENIGKFDSSAERKKDAGEALRNATSIFRQYPYLIQQYPELYASVSKSMIISAIAKKDYNEAIYIENFSRQYRVLQNWKYQLLQSNPELANLIIEIQDIEDLEKRLHRDIESFKLRRMDAESEDTEKILQQVLKKKRQLQQLLFSNPRTRNFAIAILPKLTTVKDIRNFSRDFIYIFQNKNKTHVFLRRKTKTYYASYTIESREIFQYSQNPDLHKSSPELTRLLNWVSKQKFDIIFVDRFFWRFPFQKKTEKLIARNYLFQTAILNEQNRFYSNNNWLNIQTSDNPFDDAAKESRLSKQKVSEIKKFSDLKKHKGLVNGIGIEIKVNDISNTLQHSPFFGTLLLNDKKPNVVVLSYEDDIRYNQSLLKFQSGVNLFMAAHGVSTVYHTMVSQSDSREKISKFLTGQLTPGDTEFIFSASSEISNILNTPDEKSLDIAIHKNLHKEYMEFIGMAKTELAAGNISKAVEHIKRADNIYKYRSALTLSAENRASDLVNRSAFILLKMKIWVLSDIPEKATPIFEEYLSHAILEENSNYNEIYNFFMNGLSSLFSGGYSELGFSLINKTSERYQIKTNDWLHLMNLYYLNKANRGESDPFHEPWDARFMERIHADEAGLENPVPVDVDIYEKLTYLIENYPRKLEWVKALNNMSEYAMANSIVQRYNLPYSKYLWPSLRNQLSLGSKSVRALNLSQSERKLFALAWSKKTNDLSDMAQDNDRNFMAVNIIQLLDSGQYEDALSATQIYFQDLSNVQPDYDRFVSIYTAWFTHLSQNKMNSQLIDEALQLLSGTAQDVIKTKLFLTISKAQSETLKIYSKANAFVHNAKTISDLGLDTTRMSSWHKYIVHQLVYIGLSKTPEKVLTFEALKTPYRYLYENNILSSIQTFQTYMTGLNSGEISLPGNTQGDIQTLRYALKYYLRQKMYKEFLNLYALYDRSEKPGEDFEFPLAVNGFIELFPGEHYQWSWKKDDIKVENVELSQRTTFLEQPRDVFIYIAQKKTFGTINIQETAGVYFTATFKSNLLQVLSGNTTWMSSKRLSNHPQYSLFQIVLGEPAARGIEVENVDLHLVLSEYPELMDAIQFYTTENITSLISDITSLEAKGSYHVFMKSENSLHIYLNFIRTFLQLSSGLNEFESTFFELYRKSSKQLMTKYPDIKDKQSIVILIR
ncbi:MAG: hypothetical protein ABUK01_08070 [Leptospirales bacterium]